MGTDKVYPFYTKDNSGEALYPKSLKKGCCIADFLIIDATAPIGVTDRRLARKLDSPPSLILLFLYNIPWLFWRSLLQFIQRSNQFPVLFLQIFIFIWQLFYFPLISKLLAVYFLSRFRKSSLSMSIWFFSEYLKTSKFRIFGIGTHLSVPGTFIQLSSF